jgi:hypothetical protein
MVNHFADGTELLTRTTTERGREFALPFYINDGALGPPVRLEVNVVLPSQGEVRLGPLRLVQFEPGDDPLLFPSQWWSGAQAGLILALLGLLTGALGGPVFSLSARGRARRLVLTLLALIAGMGIGLIVLGVMASNAEQPWHVAYPLLLFGFVNAAMPLALVRPVRRRYERIEMLRMSALDAS